MITFTGLDSLHDSVGRELGVSDWHEIDQSRVDAFAAATGDDQWIHLDRERAARTPLGGTIAHGYLTLSLGPLLARDLYAFRGISFGLNYGLGRVRFPAPLPVGRRVRLRVTLAAVQRGEGWAQLTLAQTFEGEGIEKPVCVAEALARLYA